LTARQSELAQQKDTVLAALRGINDQDLKIDQLNREAELARDKFMQYSRNMEEARIDMALRNERISNISVVQPATLAEKPVSPSKPLVFAATFVMAIAGPLGLMLASERFGSQLPGDDTNGASTKHVNGDSSAGRIKRRALSRRLAGQTPITAQTPPPA
jgi:uncharacterized protein involved in exopolysaccharide biosynthesis